MGLAMGGADYENTSATSTDAVSRFTSCRVLVNNGRCWSLNTNAIDVPGLTTGIMLNTEFDFWVNNPTTAYSTGGVDAVLFGTNSSNVYPLNAFTTVSSNGLWFTGYAVGRGSVSTTGAGFQVQPAGTATSGANFGSPAFQHRASIWNGSAAVDDVWNFEPFVTAGSNPGVNYEIFHPSGSTGQLNYGPQFPIDLTLFGTDGFGVRLELSNTTPGAYSKITVPSNITDIITLIGATQSLSNKTLNVPFTNGTALQFFNTTTTCTTGASVGATCTTAAITLPAAEADTAYRVACTGKGLTAVPVVIATTNSSATQFTITIAALTAAAASFTSYDCLVGHN